MNKVYACIDGQTNTEAVIDGAAWAAQRLDAPLEFLHVLERAPGHVAAADYSGAIGLGAQDALLQELAQLDEKRGRVAQEMGRRLLLAARERAAAAGVTRLDGRLRHGDLAETAGELEDDARLFVLGEHRHGGKPGRGHLDHHVERLVRTLKRPVLVVPGDRFAPPRQVVIAFDASATARRALERVAGSPLLAGLPVRIVMAASDPAVVRESLAQAQHGLRAAGFEVTGEAVKGEPEAVLPALANAPGTLLVMGAYGHTRIREFVVGSTTTALLRSSGGPVLVLR